MTEPLAPIARPRKSRNTLDRRLKYRLLGLLPGQRGRVARRKYRQLFREDNAAAFDAALRATAGQVALDLGGNMGEVSCHMARHAAHVHVFEPDPWTAAQLRDNIAGLENVTLHEAAAGTEDGEITFYRHKDFADDPTGKSVAASTVAGKRNMDHAHALTVPQVDIVRFIADLPGDVGVLKIDIEGGEVALLENLLASDVLHRVAYIFCETHETMIPDLAARTEALRKRVRGMTRPAINLDWI